MAATEMPTEANVRYPEFNAARVADAMRPGVITCEADAPLRMVAGIMASEHVHCVIVASGAGQPTGESWSIVTAADVVSCATGDIDEQTASEAAVTEFLTIAPEQPLARAAQLMTEHEVTHLVVVDADSGAPAGIVSTLDVAAVLAWGGD